MRGAIFARKHGAKMIRPERYAVGSIRKVYAKYPHLKNILPAMGYSAKQIREFESTINKAKADLVLCATPVRPEPADHYQQTFGPDSLLAESPVRSQEPADGFREESKEGVEEEVAA